MFAEMPATYRLRAVVEYLDDLRQPEASLQRWRGGERDRDGVVSLRGVEYNSRVTQFIDELYKSGLILSDFDWPAWQDEAAKYVADPALLKSASLDTCARLLTVHVRKDRFCEGHFADVLDQGHIAAIVERLQQFEDGRSGR